MVLRISQDHLVIGEYMFNQWRNWLAVHAGYSLMSYRDKGFDYETQDIDWDSKTAENFLGEWEKVPDDPLMILFVHTDNAGMIHKDHCKLLADRLDEVRSSIRIRDKTPRDCEFFRITAKFMKALYAADRADTGLEFR